MRKFMILIHGDDEAFAETREQFGGCYLAQAEDADQVIEWLELVPPAMNSAVEAREVVEEGRSFP